MAERANVPTAVKSFLNISLPPVTRKSVLKNKDFWDWREGKPKNREMQPCSTERRRADDQTVMVTEQIRDVDERHPVAGVLGIFQDITERKGASRRG